MTLNSQTHPARRFTPQQLAKLLEVTSKVECECPNHLSGIVAGLVAFEDYSADCENRHEEDRELHAFLHTETGRARAIMENALQRLLETEGIEI